MTTTQISGEHLMSSCFLHTRPVLRTRQPGFTLIELLVVISIISLMVAILLPALSKARLAAQAANCLSNMRQVGISFHMYTMDFDDSFPPHDLDKLTDGDITKNMWNWAWMMNRDGYITDRYVLRCPTALDTLNHDWTVGSRDVINHPNQNAPTPFLYITYGYSDRYLGSSWNMLKPTEVSASRRLQPARMADIRNPSKCLVLTETSYFHAATSTMAGNFILGSNAHYVHELHNRGSNILWVDGHVSHMRDTKTKLNRDAREASDPNRDEYYGWY